MKISILIICIIGLSSCKNTAEGDFVPNFPVFNVN